MQLSIPEITGRKTGSFSIAEWCRHRRVSASMYYKMKAEGWAPRTMSVGDRQLISAEADDSGRANAKPPPPPACAVLSLPVIFPRPLQPKHAEKTCASEGQTRRRKKLEVDVKDFGRGHV